MWAGVAWNTVEVILFRISFFGYLTLSLERAQRTEPILSRVGPDRLFQVISPAPVRRPAVWRNPLANCWLTYVVSIAFSCLFRIAFGFVVIGADNCSTGGGRVGHPRKGVEGQRQRVAEERHHPNRGI